MNLINLILTTTLILTPSSADREYEVNRILTNMELVECYPNEEVCDDPSQLGHYQITYGYWLDSNTNGEWEDVKDDKYAKLVIINYWRRYQPKAFNELDAEILIRTHNGGVGYDSKTDLYWERYLLIDRGLTWWGTTIPESVLEEVKNN